MNAAVATTRRGAFSVDRSGTSRAEPAGDLATLMVVGRAASGRARLAALFQDAGFTVLECADIPGARHMMRATKLDMIVLECPSLIGDELAFCQAVSAGPRVPLLILAAGADVVDEIVALELGADDLLTGHATDRLVLARARALLRRTGRQDAPAGPLPDVLGGWRLDAVTRTAISPDGESVLLSPADASALHLFLSNPGVVFTCEAGAQALGAGVRGARGFRTTVCRLRKKLNSLNGDGPIQTVWGVGYTYAPAAKAPYGEHSWPASGPRPG